MNPTSNLNPNVYYYNGSKDITEFEIPNNFTEIGKKAFWDCSSLTKITIPNSVTEIGKFAFFECSSLTNITIQFYQSDYKYSKNNSKIYGYLQCGPRV